MDVASEDTVTRDTIDSDAVDASSTEDTRSVADAGVAPDSTVDAGDVRRLLPAPTTLNAARPASVVVPSDYDGKTPLPLLIALGGYANFASDLDGWLELSDRIDEWQVALVLPDGTVNVDGDPFWNATDTCCDYYGDEPDDAAYLQALIDEAETRLAVDSARIWLLGHSNGGFMSYRLACELGDRLDAIVSIAGSSFLDSSMCDAPSPVSVLQVHGTEDDVMPFDGDSEAPGALDVLAYWAEIAACTGGIQVLGEAVQDLVLGHLVTPEGYGTGCGDSRVELWRVEGADHYPDFTLEFVPAVMTWLRSQ